MRQIIKLIIFITALLVMFSSQVIAGDDNHVLTRQEFDNWPDLPEYTIFNFFPSKGSNCTWYAHGRMLQLGYCKYALDSMHFNANSWADDAARGAEVSDTPATASIAYWESNAFFESSRGHVGVVEVVKEDGSVLVSDSGSSGTTYRTRIINPDDSIWPTAFIIVPEGPGYSKRFDPGEKVKTTANRLNFRLEGVNQLSVLLEKGTIAEVQEHVSNGIYASQPGSFFSYHYWWYAALDIDGEIMFGWMAETYLEKAGLPDNDSEPDPDSGFEGDPDAETNLDSEPEQDTEPEPEPEEHAPKPEPEPEQESNNSFNPGPEKELDLSPAYKPGDVYGDGQVNVRDAALTMHYVMKTEVFDEDQKKAADVNEDGKVDIRDVVLIMQYVLRLIESFGLESDY